ncbi:hypothetical protein N9112_00190 [bacterium]|nr:hypothetical protein [bacterium]
MKTFLLAILGLLIGFGLGYMIEARQMEKLKTGEAELSCVFPDGERKVDPALIVDLTDEGWVFENGHATNCTYKEV